VSLSKRLAELIRARLAAFFGYPTTGVGVGVERPPPATVSQQPTPPTPEAAIPATPTPAPTPQPTPPVAQPTPPPPPPEAPLGASIDMWFTYDSQYPRTLNIASDISGIEVIIYNYCSYPARLQIDSQTIEMSAATGWGGGVMSSTKTLTLPPKASYVFKMLTQLQTRYDHVDLTLNIKASKPLNVDCGGYVCGVAPQITVS